jgi:hypothetical protein
MSTPTIGRFPTRKNTVRADVLRKLLLRKQLTSMVGVIESSTTRLAADIHALQELHGWQVDRTDLSVPTADGRVATVTSYFLSRANISAAFASGARKFCEEVELARNLRRTQKKLCRQKSVAQNARRAGAFYDQWQIKLDFPR